MPDEQKSRGLSYRDAGVDIDAGNSLVERIKPTVKRTLREGVLGSIGGFGGLFELPTNNFTNPVLVSGTDGVGTKLRLAIDLKKYDTVGIDLVAMCVNDIIVAGAEPLYFLDYYATGKLDVDTAASVIEGIAEGCIRSGAALIGGETAEMPGMYTGDDLDLAGFAVGIVEKDRILDGSKVQAGDVLLGINSSGPHSNGYSLIRKILESSDLTTSTPFEDKTLGDALLEPTRIYVKPLLALMEKIELHALAHITGGGLPENLPRVLRSGLGAEINAKSWQRPAVFDLLQKAGEVEDAEMYRTFNCGIGMVVVVADEDAENALQLLQSVGETVQVIGKVTASDKDTAASVNIL